MLFGEGPRELEAPDVPSAHEDLAEQPAGAPLFCQGELELGRRYQALVGEQEPQRAPWEVGLVHRIPLSASDPGEVRVSYEATASPVACAM
jgi:hypothetical protein